MWRKLVSQVQQEICPYCFEYFYLKDTPFRCSSPPSRCAPQADSVYQQAWQDSRPMGKVLKPGKRFDKSVRCTDCGNQSHKRICPHCHIDLPHTTGQFKNYIFAVIGAKESGKSHYLAVLINQIKKQLGPNLNMLLEPMNDETIKRYREKFYNPVFNEGKVIQATDSAMVDRNVQKPLVYSLTISGNHALLGDRIKKAVILVFFDTAGEDLDDEDVMSTVNKYIFRSDGVLLLIDPLQLMTVRNQVSSDTGLPEIQSETSDIINRTTRLIENGRGLNPADKIKTPLAVAFSKFDALKPLIDPQFQLLNSANHQGGFDDADFQAINSEMEALLQQWGSQDIVQHVQTRYPNYGFFGLSALGCNPHSANNKISSVLPWRVEDPFLWLLAQNKIINKVRFE